MTTHLDPWQGLVRDLEEEQMRAVQECPACHGSGEVRWNPGWPDPQCEESAACSRCGGTGAVDGYTAYEDWLERQLDLYRETEDLRERGVEGVL